MKLFLSLILLTTILQAPSAAAPQDQKKQSDAFVLENNQKRARNPAGLIFTLQLKDKQTQFHQGEVIRLELSFSSSSGRKFILDDAGYDRSGRLAIDTFILDRRDGTVDPLYDYFNSGLFGFVGGGLRGMPELSAKPKVLIVELNEWLRFEKPGHYRLYVVSGRIATKLHPDDRYGKQSSGMVSNIVEFDILPANEKWEDQKLNEAKETLAKRDVDNHRAACRSLRFLGTTAAAREMVKRFGVEDQNCNFEYRFGLISSPHRDFVIRTMERALSSPEHPVTSSFTSTLALLAYTRQATAPPPYPAGNDEQIKQWQLQLAQRRNSHDQILLSYLRQLVVAIPQKQEEARATSLQTLLDYQASLKTSDLAQWQDLLATMPDVFSRLTLDAQIRLLTYQWKPIASAAMLPVLREILKQSDNKTDTYQQTYQQVERRSIALRRLYEISPEEGRQLIIDEIRRPTPRVHPRALRSLPDEKLPELDDVLATNLEETRKPNGSGGAEAISDLIERYATAGILPRVRAVYEGPGPGRWACRIQASLLAYILRADPAAGGELLNKALTARGEGLSRCYTSTLSDVAQLQMSAEVEEAADTSLDESDPEMVSQAASVLGRYGSADAEKKLWQRLQKWHEEMESRGGELSKQNPGLPAFGRSDLSGQAMIEQALRNALSHGQAWLLDLENLKRLQSLCLTDGCHKEVDNTIRGWNRQIHVGLNSFEDQPLSISVAHYQLNSLESLKQKLLQFPSGTLFTFGSTTGADNDVKAQDLFRQLKGYLEEHGMKVELETKP
jgi:hypothetical protein